MSTLAKRMVKFEEMKQQLSNAITAYEHTPLMMCK